MTFGALARTTEYWTTESDWPVKVPFIVTSRGVSLFPAPLADNGKVTPEGTVNPPFKIKVPSALIIIPFAPLLMVI